MSSVGMHVEPLGKLRDGAIRSSGKATVASKAYEAGILIVKRKWITKLSRGAAPRRRTE
jgi:hypothetical protein